jgi:predicted metal-dependent phosphotriesterase family hydrolase
MTAVPAVRGGSVADTELGFTLMHEHIFVLSPEVTQNWPETFGDEQQRIAGAVAALDRAKAAGVDTIVDLTVIGAGRCIPLIQRVAAQTEVNIIVATGVYTWNDLRSFSAWSVRERSWTGRNRWTTSLSVTSRKALARPACGPGYSNARPTGPG